jgi:Alpha/beta hydrolase family
VSSHIGTTDRSCTAVARRQSELSNGLIDLAARKYRVIAFDRPGFGHSARPRNTVWTPEAQAGLIGGALVRIGASEAMVLGHSWGTLVAVVNSSEQSAMKWARHPNLRKRPGGASRSPVERLAERGFFECLHKSASGGRSRF